MREAWHGPPPRNIRSLRLLLRAAALTLDRQGKRKDGIAEVQRFHRRLCELRVLDPAYGSGNFLTSRSSS